MSDIRLIDGNAVLCFIKDEINESKEEKNEARARDCESDAAYNSGEIQEAIRIKRHILNAPTISAVPVVRCRECKKRTWDWHCPFAVLGWVEDDGFCHWGEKRDGGEADG